MGLVAERTIEARILFRIRRRDSWLVGAPLLSCLAAGAPWLVARPAIADEPIALHRHTNPDFLFSVEEPTGLECETALPPLPNHGCQIELNSGTKSRLSVYGEYNVFDHANPEAAMSSTTGWLLRPGVSVNVLRREPARLGGLKAERLALRIEEPGERGPRVRDWVVALRSVPQWGDIVYTVVLDTTEERYVQDVVHFEAMVRSWRAEEPPSK